MSAEIQSFVETTNNDDVEITQNTEHKEIITKNTASPKIHTSNEGNCVIKEEQKSSVKATKLESKVEEEHESVCVIKENTSSMTTSNDLINNSIEQENVPVHKIAENNTTEVVNVTTIKTKNMSNEVNKPSEVESNINQVSNDIVTKTNESKEIKSNGAIPKKSNNSLEASASDDDQQQQQQIISIVDDLCIKETNSEKVSQKPVPLKRQTKPEPEVGHVECIHIHVESPRATPRNDHTSGISSFKTNESHEAIESITTKTPFVLTSPPTHRRKIQSQTENVSVTKETVNILKSPNRIEQVNELNINEERINTKPEILVKPTLSPKPILKDHNGKNHSFAEIHKPVRNKYFNNQNGHVRRASRDDAIPPPLVPSEGPKEIEGKITSNSTSIHIHSETDGSNAETQSETNLTIIEINKPIEKNDDKQHKEINSEYSLQSAKESLKPEDEFDLLYRPKPFTQMEWKRSTLAPLETNIPPEKRKSVKDIIESINRSQRLLNAAANKDFTALNATTTNPPGLGTDIITNQTKTVKTPNPKNTSNEVIVHETQEVIQHVHNDVADVNGAAAISPSPSPSPSNYNNETADAQKLDNNDIFQKCKVKKEVYDYREASPISSNLDWNPVPKPKRTKPGQD